MQPTNTRMPNGVSFRFSNIGPIIEAELDLGDLTIIAGHNNTGKTYLVYTLYGFLKKWSQKWNAGYYYDLSVLRSARESVFWNIITEIRKKGESRIPVNRQILMQERKKFASASPGLFRFQRSCGYIQCPIDRFHASVYGIAFRNQCFR